MVCRVCKRELTDGVVCSFCGEDNTPYINSDSKEQTASQAIENTEEKDTAKKHMGFKSKKSAKVKSNYKLNKKKLARFVIVVVLAIVLIFFVANLFGSDDKEPQVQSGNTLFSSGMLSVAKNGEWGYVNLANPSVFAIEPQFVHITDFHNDLAAVCIGGKFGLIDKDGILVCEPIFDSVGDFSDNGLIAVEANGKWGYVDELGEYVIEPKFATAYEFAKNGMAAVSVSGSYGYIGDDGEYTIAPQYDMAFTFADNGLAAVKTGDKWGYIDEGGTAVIEPKYQEAFSFENGYAVVKQHGDYGMIDIEGKTVIAPQFDDRFCFDGEYAKVKTGKKYGIIDINGKYVINPRYYDIGTFGTEGLAFAKRGDGKYGFINMNDEFVINPSYDGAGNFRCGLAPVKKDGLWGYIDKEGNMVIDTKYLYASEFYEDGFAYVKNVDGSVMVITPEGKMAVLESSATIDNILK